MKQKLTEDNYVEIAESTIKTLKNKKNQKGFSVPLVTTSKIRNILSMTADLYTDVLSSSSEKLSSDMIGRINYLKLRIVYEYGRDTARERSVQAFIDEAGLLEYIETAKSSRSAYILFSRYMEALVAYHKYYGGKD